MDTPEIEITKEDVMIILGGLKCCWNEGLRPNRNLGIEAEKILIGKLKKHYPEECDDWYVKELMKY